jgi:hypothetical protein
MTDEATTWLVVNSASGSNDVDAIANVRQALAAGAAAPSHVIDIQAGPGPDIAALRAGGVGRLAIFAGDGTISRIVTGLEGWEGGVLVLPGGTANLLARALHGDRDAPAIASACDGFRAVRRHVIRCSRGTALIEILAGPGAVWSDVREGLRENAIAEVTASGAEAIEQSIAGPTVHLRLPPVGRDGGYAGIRLVPGDGGMDISGYGAETFGDYLRQGVALLRRDYREGPHDALGHHREALCRSSDDGPIELMIDGERQTGAREERFSLAELAVDLLADG